MDSTHALMETYFALWNTTDSVERRHLAEQALAEHGSITYPSVQASGWDDVVKAIGALHERVAGIRFVSTSGVEEHHGWIRASWRMLHGGQEKPLDGIDVGELAEDGRFRRVIGFYDPLPPPGEPN